MVRARRISRAIFLVLLATKCPDAANAGAPDFSFMEDFESFPEGSVQGRSGWLVAQGEAAVITGVSRLGEKALQTGEGSEASLALEVAESIIWVEVWVRTAGGPMVPAIPSLPKKSAAVIFDCVEGIQALDGDGTGGGTVLNSGDTLDESKWRRITVKLDFGNKKWDLYVDGQPRLKGLGFHSNDVAGLSGMVRASCAESYLDTLSFTSVGLTDDGDQDGLSDLDEIQLYGTDPLSADTDDDGMEDGDEIIAGTRPTDSQSFLYLRIAAGEGAGVIQLSAPTVTGKRYQLQATDDIGVPDSWRGVAEFVGDGLIWALVAADDAPAARRFYRLVVFP